MSKRSKVVYAGPDLDDHRRDDDEDADINVGRLVGTLTESERKEIRKDRRQLTQQTQKKTYADLDERTRKWRTARSRFLEEVKDEMFAEDCIKLSLYTMEEKDIEYADDPDQANALATSLIRTMEKEERPYYFVGCDFEGNKDEVMQLHTFLDARVFAFVFQINFLADNDGLLPPRLIRLLSDIRIVFIGKNIEKDITNFFLVHNFGEERLKHIKIIDILSLVQIIDLASRDTLDDAIAFAQEGKFRPSTDYDDDANVIRDVFSNAGIRAGVRVLCDKAIDKRTRHVWDKHTDWTRKIVFAPNRMTMTKTMLLYGSLDAKAGYDTAREASKLLKCGMKDFVTVIGSPQESFLLTGNLLRRFEQQKENPDLDMAERIKIRKFFYEMMKKESARRRQCHDLYVAKRDPWRTTKGYPPIQENPFVSGGDFDQMLEYKKDFTPPSSSRFRRLF